MAVQRHAAPARKSGGADARTALLLADDFLAGEKLRDFFGGGVGSVRAVHRVLADRLGERLADRAGAAFAGSVAPSGRDRRQSRSRPRAPERPPARDHEIHELAEERPLPVHAIESLGLRAADRNALLRDDAQPACSIIALIAPVRLRAVASGLMIEKVRSIAIRSSLEKSWRHVEVRGL